MATLQSNIPANDRTRRLSIDTTRLNVKVWPDRANAYLTIAVDDDTRLVIGHRIDTEPPAWPIVMEWLRAEVCPPQ
jgi:hypothetical protein